MTARIVTTTYRYKPPPKRKGRKLAEITGPAVITSVDPKKSSRRAVLAETAAKEELSTRSPAGDTEPSTPPGKAPTPANDDGPRRSASVTAKEKPHRTVRQMDLPLSRKPVEREGDDYKRMRDAMARRLRGE